ncbi:MAG: rpfG 4 [Clostridiales bacterium]|jgi:putative nucleotidyltransferase with HDIG domain|nr:rpfG 4 [Clostridiales bacterium]
MSNSGRIDFIDYHDIIECISGAMDARDSYTSYHSQRVSDMAKIICTMLGFNKKDIEEIHVAAHLHDIGKIGIPDAVLNKEGKLTQEEWIIMKSHSRIGADILAKSERLDEISNIVLHHHERYDGNGYPNGVSGVEIPVGSRIISICDSIDAMTTKRSYRKAHNFDFCYSEIEKNLGLMYDPIIGKYVLENWEEIIETVKEENVI